MQSTQTRNQGNAGWIRWSVSFLLLGLLSGGLWALTGTVYSQSATCQGMAVTVMGATEGDDTLTGTSGPDVIAGLGGNDVINGMGGDDIICGDDGDDIIDGGADNDTIYGGDHEDTLSGGDGDDELFGDDKDDILNGGLGNDILHGGVANDLLNGDEDDDTLFGDGGADTLNGHAGNDTLNGGDGNDTLNGHDGDDVLDGGANLDILSGGDGHDILRGGDGNDTITGGVGDDYIDGGSQHDTLSGGVGRDVIIGGDGNDIIDGDADDDIINADGGVLGNHVNDSIDGGPGTDRCYNGETVVNCEEEGVDTVAPIIDITAPNDPSAMAPTLNVIVDYSDADSGVDLDTLLVEVDGADITHTCDTTTVPAVCAADNLALGLHTITAEIRDRAVNLATDTHPFTVVVCHPPGSTRSCYEDDDPATEGVGICQAGTETCQADNTYGACEGQVLPEPDDIPGNGLDDNCNSVVDETMLPPDPMTVAPPVDTTIATNLFDATEFLYNPDDPEAQPIQTQIDDPTQPINPNVIEARRVAVLRGLVKQRDETPLSGVQITILDHPEYGQTLSRADGMFDLAVNGGGQLVVNYAKDGYLPAQRTITPPWQGYAYLPDVVLIQPDTQVTQITLAEPDPLLRIAQGSLVTDSDGSRIATVLFPENTTATMTLPDGSTSSPASLNIRLTEYTVGDNGPEAMPGELPPSSAYTYAVELSADEALNTGAVEVRFDKPIQLYVDNFLGFAGGTAVPVGSYDQAQAAWVPSANGRVLKIVDVDPTGMAQIDADGDDDFDGDDQTILDTLQVSNDELMQLAAAYPTGQSVWRVEFLFFSRWDCNWPGGPPVDAIPPNGPIPAGGSDAVNPDATTLDEPDSDSGSGILFQNQVLQQTVELTGTPFTLQYSSDRVGDRDAAYSVEIPLSGDTIPASLERIDLEVRIAGRKIRQSFPATPNQTTTFVWDRLDAYGRELQGRHPTEIFVEFVYDVVYQEPAQIEESFGQLSGMPLAQGANPRAEVVLGRKITGMLGAWDTLDLGLGGWSLDIQHAYDPISQTLYLGDGARRSSSDIRTGNQALGIQTVAGSARTTGSIGDGGPATDARLNFPTSVAFDSVGNMYIADKDRGRVRMVDQSGIISTIAGDGTNDPLDGMPAVDADFSRPWGVAVDGQDQVYFSDNGDSSAVGKNHSVWKIDTAGLLQKIAGVGTRNFSGDGGPAILAELKNPRGIALDGHGNVYIADTGNHRVRKVDPNGIITTVAGNGNGGGNTEGNGDPATEVGISLPRAIAFDSQGNFYITDSHAVIRKVTPAGVLTTFAGTYQSQGFSGDGGPALQAEFGRTGFSVEGITVDATDNVIVVDNGAHRIRLIDTAGIIRTIAGTGTFSFSGDGGPPTQAALAGPQGVGVSPTGDLYIADAANDRVRRVQPPLPGFSGLSDLVIASKDGSELYVFNDRGRHLRTVNTLTNTEIRAFTYDGEGRLVAVTERVADMPSPDDLITTIQRDAAGNPISITSPFGQVTTLGVDSSGYVNSIAAPMTAPATFGYSSDGLMTSRKTPNGATTGDETIYTYEPTTGRLTSVKDPEDGANQDTLTRMELANGYEVMHTSAAGYDTRYKVEFMDDGQQKRTNSFPDNTTQTTEIRTDGSRLTTERDGTLVEVIDNPDPRFGMQALTTQDITVDTPGGTTSTLTSSRDATLSDPNDPLSLQAQTDTFSLNGRNFTSAYATGTQAFTDTTPDGRTRTTIVDDQGRVTSQQIGTLTPTTFVYDGQGRLSTLTQGSRTSTLSYTPEGELASIEDPLNREISFEYDAAGRVTKQTLPDLREILFSYDDSGNVTSITPPGRPAHMFQYTGVDQEKEYLPPNVTPPLATPQTQMTYTQDGDIERITRPDGQVIDFVYDSAGRLERQILPTGDIVTTYEAGTGNRETVTAPSGSELTLKYDGALVTDMIWAGPVGGSVEQTYDDDLRVASRSVNGSHTINFTYDVDSQLESVGDPVFGPLLALGRDANGQVTGSTLDTVTDATVYSGFGESDLYTVDVNSNEVFKQDYFRDDLGRITRIIETLDTPPTSTTFEYTYDLAGRLEAVTAGGTTVATYTYDANSNRTSATLSGVTTNGTYDAQDRLLTYGSASYTYTDNGELATKTVGGQTTTYTYDVLGNLVQVDFPNGDVVEYIIDGDNRRVGKKLNTSLIQGFLYHDELNPVAELDGNGAIVSRFVYGSKENVPDYMIQGTDTYRIISDQVGSVRLVIDTTTGVIEQRIDYDAFGNITQDTNPGFQPFGFAGGLFDQHTYLTRFGARDYDAETGRWTAKDPIRFDGGDTNLYGYVINDPINLLDSSGELLSLIAARQFRQGLCRIAETTFHAITVLSLESFVLQVLQVQIELNQEEDLLERAVQERIAFRDQIVPLLQETVVSGLVQSFLEGTVQALCLL